MADSGQVRKISVLVGGVVLPVAISVASNQVLNNGVWNWWWTLAAVTLSAVSVWVASLLARRAGISPTPSNTARDSEPLVSAVEKRGQGQVVAGTSSDAVWQLADIQGNVRIGAAPHRRIPVSPEAQGQNQDVSAEPALNGISGQAVKNTRISGSIIQIKGVGGDAEINEP